ncbi:MAG TPA: cytochrome c biogenesis protein CcdA [Deltaproteobacteria bacterium]|nr:cytochrome c biogenesis protein CcdA [Deltaproteobacteria bacterium]HPR53904.1 cytochrome c biogenesis protein CcdA [Deltaproteobacteria bacterium]HXK46704.1 cytochrome c biogenesis protein CcdA [Deltaproteobacteria bacterium]
MIENLASNLDVYLKGSMVLSFAAAYIGGVLVSFTPCMYPLIPITVSYIGAQGKISRATGFLLSLLYVLGTSLTYTILGSIAGLTGSFFGELQTNPWMNLIIANIFILMGLSMLDVFFLPLPDFLRSQMFSPKRRGYLGALLLGIASGLIMSPCSAPVLAVLLSYVAAKQNIFFGMTLLFVFAFGMGSLLIVLGTFTGLLTSIPKSGPWMVRIQKLFGFIFIAMGEYFLITAGTFLV